jgi:hypothetical protein
MRKSGLSDSALATAVDEMAHGLIDADLGGHLVKKRLPLPGQGKRGGARTIVATRLGGRWFFLFGFGKNERDSIDDQELKALQEIAKDWLNMDDASLSVALSNGNIMEVDYGQE